MTNNIDDEWNQFLLQFSNNGSSHSDYMFKKKEDIPIETKT